MMKLNNIPVEPVLEIIRHVGDEILIPNWSKVSRIDKDDGPPVTVVDQAASAYLIDSLRDMTPDIPVVSEEASYEENVQAMDSDPYWLTDPLDGTATYLSGPYLGKEAGFGVHLALISDGEPVMGIAYFPAQNKMYYTGNDGGAYLQIGDDEPEQISVSHAFERGKIQAAVPWLQDKRPENVNSHDYESVPAVGGEMICRVASGDADLMWHNRPDTEGAEDKAVFSHWDVAAAHAILKAAGGNLYEMGTGDPVTYNNTDFVISTCVAGDSDLLRQVGFYTNSGEQSLDFDQTP